MENPARQIRALGVGLRSVYRWVVGFASKTLKHHPWWWLLLASSLWVWDEEAWRRGRRLIDCDVLMLCGTLLFLIGSHFALWIPDKLTEMLERLHERGVLQGSQAQLQSVLRDLKKGGSHWVVKILVVVATFCVLLAYYIAYEDEVVGYARNFTLGSMLAGFIAFSLLKSAFGPALLHGSLIGLLKKHGVKLRLFPEHPDGAGGFGLVRSYYTFQALVIAIPAIHLGGWWFILAFGEDSPAEHGSAISPTIGGMFSMLASRYSDWRLGYLLLFFVVLTIEVLAFVIPLWKFHRAIQEAKESFEKDHDRLAFEALELKESLLSAQAAPEQIKSMKDRLDLISTRMAAVEKVSLWPINLKIAWGSILGHAWILSLLLRDIHRLGELGGYAPKLLRDIVNVLKT